MSENTVDSKVSKKIRDYKAFWSSNTKENEMILYGDLHKIKKYREKKEIKALDSTCVKRIMELSKKNEILIYSILLSGFRVQINSYLGREFMLNIPVFSKEMGKREQNSLLPMKCITDITQTVSDYIKSCKLNITEMYKRQAYPLVESKIGNIYSQFIFGMSDIHKKFEPNRDISDKRSTIYINAKWSNEKIEIIVSYDENNYSDYIIKNLLKNYEFVLKNMIFNLESKIGEIPCISDNEKEIICKEFNNTSREYPKNSTLKELFEKIAEENSEKVAIVSGGESVTYFEVNKRANKVAHYLKKKGVKKGEIVSILCDKSINTIIGIIGIIKSGAGYLPIDNQYPEDRILYMIKDANCKILIGSKNNMSKKNIEIKKYALEKIIEMNIEDYNIMGNYCNEDLAYIIYTSGSTGNPKGVCVSNRNVVRLIKNMNYIDLNEKDRILLTGSIAFDASTFEVWGSLLNGLRLYIESKNLLFDVEKYEEYLVENSITIQWFTSALFEQLCKINIGIFKNLKWILTGGDIISAENMSKFFENISGTTIIACYGPTENTTYSTTYKIQDRWEKNVSIPIGKPISNSTCYVMNEDKKLQPIGVPGELYVGGDGVAKEYLNNSKLTKERFIENPHVEGERIYKTGDYAMWTSDGNILFLGRKDNQVKIRGFRIELNEVEREIEKIKAVNNVVVLDKKNNMGEKYLSAFYTVNSEISSEQVREILKAKLPKYMVPSFIINLKEMPLSTTGKIDRKQLQAYSEENEIRDIVLPRNEMEKLIADAWSSAIGVECISIKDNFLDVGGDSLKAISVVSKIKSELSIKVEVRDIFNEKSLEDIAVDLSKREKIDKLKIKEVKDKEWYKVSSAQKRMYAINQIDRESTNYNMPYLLKAKEKLNPIKIEKVIKNIIKRHEILRTVYTKKDGEVLQKVESEKSFRLKKIIVEESCEKCTQLEDVIRKLVKPFNLDLELPIRAFWVSCKEEELVLIDIHHIAADGTSFQIFLEEFKNFYSGVKPKYEPTQYKDYANWIYEMKSKSDMSEKEDYWFDVFKNEVPVLNIETDLNRPINKTFNGEHLTASIDNELLKSIENVRQTEGVSKNMIYLSALYVLLSKYSSQKDIVIGIPASGRVNCELEYSIGMFINSLPIRIKHKSEETFREILRNVKINVLKATQNQEYPIDELINKLELNTPVNRNPLFDVMFSYNEFGKDDDFHKHKENNFQVSEVDNKISKFDMTVIVSSSLDNDKISIEYCTDIFTQKTIDRFMKSYMKILKKALINLDIQLRDISAVSTNEKKKLLEDFNGESIRYPRQKRIEEIFNEIAKENMDKTAIVSRDKKITYKELDLKSDKVSQWLRAKGVCENQIVSVVCKKNIDTVVAILGVIKCGAVCLPIDENNPKERIKFYIEDSKCKIVISDKSEDFLNELGLPISVSIDEIMKSYVEDVTIKNLSTSNHCAHVIYTSGSTGKPKGVYIKHMNVVRLVKNNEFFQFEKSDRVLQTGSMGFDAAIFEIWGALLNGSCLYIEEKDIVLNSSQLRKYMIENEISTMFITAALFEQFSKENTSEFEKLKCILTGGDVASPKAVAEILKKNPKIKIINAYGPTENGVMSSAYVINDHWDENKKVPIGKPVSNSTCYIFDDDNKIVPVNVVGELCVGGDGLSPGYLNRDDETSKKFVLNPYNNEELLYKTGDMAKWNEDGEIIFMGRRDMQIKIRGYRIEIEEIEKVLEQEVDDVAVICKIRENGDKYLCGFIENKSKVEVNELKKRLREKLPSYMIPTVFKQIEKLPINMNGKIDKSALQKMEVSSYRDIKLPRNVMEMNLVEVFKEVLDFSEISIDDDFFDIGGNSVLVINLITKIEEKIGVNIPISIIYELKTVRNISKEISDNYSDYKELITKEKNVILIKKGRNSRKNLFFIPDGTGDPATFINIINNLNEEFTCWGIKSKKVAEVFPVNVNVKEEAREFCESIREIQKNGPYNIIAFCYGAYITTEIVKHLEEKNILGNEVILIDSIPIVLKNKELNNMYGRWELFTVEEEINYINKELKGVKYDKNAGSVKILWQSVINLNKKMDEKTFQRIKRDIHQRFIVSRNDIDTISFSNFIKHINAIRSNENATFLLKSEFKNAKLISKTCFIKASENQLFEDEFDNWKDTYVNCEFEEVEGTHFSIIKDEGAKTIGTIINNRL